MDIVKKNNTTFIETMPEKVVEKVEIEGTLDGVIADINGTTTWLQKSEEEVMKATKQLEELLKKKKTIEDLGIITNAEKVTSELEAKKLAEELAKELEEVSEEEIEKEIELKKIEE